MLSPWLHEFNEHTARRGRMNKVDSHLMRTVFRAVIDQTVPPCLQPLAKRLKPSLFHAKGEVMNPWTSFFKELSDRSFGIHHFKDLKPNAP